MEHFAKEEIGIVMSMSEAAETMKGTSAGGSGRINLDQACIQTTSQISVSFAKSKERRGLGVGNEPGEVLAQCPEELTVIYAPLLAKVQTTLTEPSMWKLTRYCAAFKGAGKTIERSNYRFIGLGFDTAKHHHAFLRSLLLAAVNLTVMASQCADFKGRGTDMAHHIVQSFQSLVMTKTYSAAIVVHGHHRGALSCHSSIFL